MAIGMPTQPGDVLILKTCASFLTHAVGAVCRYRQQDFRNQPNVSHVTDFTEALGMARALNVPGGRVFMRNIDTDDWSDISQTLNLNVDERKTA